MIEELVKNIDAEIELLREVARYSQQLDSTPDLAEKKVLEGAIGSLRANMKTINASIPKILTNITLAKPLNPANIGQTGLSKISIEGGVVGGLRVTLNKHDKERFLSELSISESYVKRLKQKKKAVGEEYVEFKSSRGYLKYSNKWFLETAKRFIERGEFKALAGELRKANIDMLLGTYVAMMIFTSVLAAIIGFFTAVFLVFFNVGITFPFFSLYSGDFFPRILYLALIPIISPIVTFFFLYYYPSTEKGSLAKRIDQELPFAVIHMSSISGSGIEPSEIFKIIGTSKEYPHLKREVRKVMNQINIYGYDLVTSLNNVAKSTPSAKLGELFSGVATTITSGGSLSEFFEKRAETLLLAYRLERERYGKLAETFMDIYISVVIATPMILMLLLIILSISAPDMGFSPGMITLLIVGAVALINAFFLIFLHLKQPSY